MAERRSEDLLRRLSLAAGPPGAEDEVRALVRTELERVGNLQHDRLGSLICEKPGRAAAPRVVLDCHLDEVALMAQNLSAEGLIAFVPLGGWWGHVLLGQRVEILTRRGEKIPGVIGSTPPHFLDAEARARVQPIETMYVDVGASSRQQVEALGIRVGDVIVPASEFRQMAIAGVVYGKALDNRAGVALMCETLCDLVGTEHPNTVIGVAAVQEELGARGAGTAMALARPDVALVLECTPADDLPNQPQRQAVLGGGPQIRHYDPTAVSNRRLVRLVEQTAEQEGIPLQMAVRRSGGTDAQTIQRHGAGVPTVVIGVPARYIHSHGALLQMQDYLAARKLLLALVGKLDLATTAALTRFD